MKKSIEVPIPPSILKILRETSGYSIDEIAKKLGTSREKIERVENGESLFTLTQIKKLANIYKRPLAAFFSDTISELPSLTDYRINREKRLTPQVYLARRKAYYLSNEIRKLSDKKSKIPYFYEGLKPYELANEFRKRLNIDLIKNERPKKILTLYKRKIEEKLFVPVIEYPLKADDVRAFSIFSDVSIIVLNEEDTPQIKLFSLFHELCHLLKKNSGICSIELEEEGEEIESYCNQFAAEFLVPAKDLKLTLERMKLTDFNWDDISELSKIYGVSKQVIMLRLLWLGYIKREKYIQFKDSYVKELEEKKFGRKNWDEVFFNRAGNLIIQEVNRAYKRGDISFADVISTLDIKTKYVEKFVGAISE